MKIDYRSDTVTKPTPEMKEFMFQAPVGDDVFVEDPSINELEQFSAEMFGMEAGIYCPSGTMTNQIAIKAHTNPGDELICSYESHIYRYEGGGIAYNSGVSARLIPGDSGLMTLEDVEKNINPDDIHFPVTRLVSLENTSNRGGGLCYDLSEIKKISAFCKAKDLKLHLDGARLFNALVATKTTAKDYGDAFDSISICLSKGLGAPVGSVLLGTKETIVKARRIRKVFGGGMRQAGVIAAGGLFALKNNIERLEIDHKHAQILAQAALSNPIFEKVEKVETNIVMLYTTISSAEIVDKLAEKNVLCYAMGPNKVRMVTHLDISELQIQQTTEILKTL
ncbi:MAG: threonine aldolase [Flavobacteriales bacterium]|jgi:threonine aldolase